ncbi:hypothetical protein BYT27DRAFT_7111451 [Phlegmacium glaucopus]|nr:hypothetical protein BYT27DRAFT_7111451 [Phlegmacium glaucopus]
MDLRGGNVLITGGTFNSFARRNTGFTFLRSCIADGALHNSGERFDPPKCHPGTRVAVLRAILKWIQEDQYDSFIMWLFGPAGAGKSALAQTIAEICYGDGRLAASFFFSRSSPKRSDSTSLIATIAYQIALNIPASRSFIEDAIETDPSICSMSLQTQLDTLVIKPLANIADHERSTWPRLIIIDGLDECHDPKVQSYILNVFASELRSGRLPFKVLVASRPEPHISLAFQLGNVQPITTRLCLDDTFFPDADIRLFLQDKFTEIKRVHPLKNYIPVCWPAEDSIDELVRKSSGQFIYAATVIRYLASIYHRPTERLKFVLGLSPILREIDNPFAELDTLYTHVLSSVDNIEITLRILGLSLISQLQLSSWRSYNQTKLEILMSLSPGDIQLYLSNIVSLVNLSGSRVTFLHASLGDFLLDKCRSGPYYIDLSDTHEYAARCHLRLLTMPGTL